MVLDLIEAGEEKIDFNKNIFLKYLKMTKVLGKIKCFKQTELLT